MEEQKQKFLILDGNALIHRAFHALPSTMITKEGIPTNAIYGFVSAFLKVLNDIEPEYVAVCFDVKKETFRNEIYKEYKANRIKQPDELYAQFPHIKEVVECFNIKIFEKEGFEADDVIGTICKKFDNTNIETIILTGDKDTLQLVDKDTKVYTFKTGISEVLVYDELMVKEKMGVTPNQVIDYKALRGDPSDNIPGVKGIGEKTASDLLNKYNTLENLYKNIENGNVEGITERILNLLKDQKELAFLSYKLSTIERNVDIDFNLEDCKKIDFNIEKLRELFIKLEFRTLLERVLKTDKSNTHNSEEKNTKESLKKINQENNKNNIILEKEKDIELFLNKLEKEKEFIFNIEGNFINKINNIIGICFSIKENQSYYLDYKLIKNNNILFNKLKNIFEDINIKKISHDIKNNAHILKRININLNNIYFDTMIAAYIIYPGERNYSIDKLAFSEFGELTAKSENSESANKKIQATMDFIDPIKNIKEYLENCNYIFRLYKKYSEEINKNDKTKDLFFNIEMSIVEVLLNMEENGILLDINYLKELSSFYEEKIKNIEKYIFNITGDFNLNSPKQLQEILFNKLNLNIKGIKKIKTGISTASDELEKLRDNLIEISENLAESNTSELKDNSANVEIIEILNKIIEYREYQKLKTTYIDSLPKLIWDDKKIHTTFNQVITATGRLSSSDPNLQNIPIRTEDGNKIRKAFIAREGYKLVGIDYSQIELRVIASLANEKTMIDSFKNNLDIHKVTASIVNNIKLEDVTKEQRRAAKAVNFGVIYGMGPRKLSRDTGLSFKDAREYIKRYFEINKNIEIYIDNLINFARENEYIENIIGRKRYLKDINSYQDQIKNQSERMAQNMPIQGLAADIMKLAMRKVYERITKEFGNQSEEMGILLQVHDELVFEIKENKTDFIKEIVYEMENAFILPNEVKLKVEVEIGNNWGEMEDYKI